MTSAALHAAIVATLACLTQPADRAAECIAADPDLRAHAETLARLSPAEPETPLCIRFRSCGRR